tara:strand:- start:656 stop:907 length:252 start_codon:yes stop_codon:yes gene_type:complete
MSDLDTNVGTSSLNGEPSDINNTKSNTDIGKEYFAAGAGWILGLGTAWAVCSLVNKGAKACISKWSAKTEDTTEEVAEQVTAE